MKIRVIIFLFILFAGCKKEECEPISNNPPPVPAPTKQDSLDFIWKLDTMYRTQGSSVTVLTPVNSYLSFKSGTVLYIESVQSAISPYEISNDTIYLDYSIPNIPTNYYKIEALTNSRLIVNYVSPISSAVSLRNIYTKQ